MAQTFSHDYFAQLDCPKPVTWTNDVAKLFTAKDVAHMKQVTGGALDLSSYDSTKVFASKIYQEVSSGAMPPPGSGESPWSKEMVNTFGCWVKQGCPQ
jgi:hypothetical protein